jgi:hypothetical protein
MPAIVQSPISNIKVADEVFIATALLHRENPHRSDFTLQEIVGRAKRENLYGELRPGVLVHTSTHCVANRPPNPGRYRMLFATGKSTRRLLRAGDAIEAGRDGKILPNTADVPEAYKPLIEWARERYGETPEAAVPRRFGDLLGLRGVGRDVWADDDADGYVQSLREGWV